MRIVSNLRLLRITQNLIYTAKIPLVRLYLSFTQHYKREIYGI